MPTATAILISLVIFLIGLYLCHRWQVKAHMDKLKEIENSYPKAGKVIRYSEDLEHLLSLDETEKAISN